MMASTFHKQEGYLLIVAVIIVFVFSAVGAILAVGYVRKGEAVLQSQQAQQALYIAASGLEIAKNKIINGSETCSDITGDSQLTNAPLLSGHVTVTGSEDDTTNTLSENLSASATSLTLSPMLSNAGSFAPEGVVVINSEKIGYYNRSGNVLQHLKRGLGGTTAASHRRLNVVSQHQCLLKSTGAIPDFTDPKGKQTVQEVLDMESSGGGHASANIPVIMTASAFDLSGSAKISNTGVDMASPEYQGSTILSGGQVNLRGPVETYVSNGSGGITLSSTSSHIQPDIQAYDSSITSNHMHQFFFSEPLTTIYSIADHSYDKTNISGIAGKTVWIDGNLVLNKRRVSHIGTDAAPVVLVIDGNLVIKSRSQISLYGLIYVTGKLRLANNTSIDGEGAIASQGDMDIEGSMDLELNPSVLSNLSLVNPYMNSSTSYGSYLLRRVNI